MLNISYWQEFVETSHRVLLLQGPIGPYFAQLKDCLRKDHKQVYKLNFNAGDYYYYTDHLTHSFTEPIDQFYDYLMEFVKKYKIDSIVCFGHKREYHKIAKQVCLDLDKKVTFWSFEEGYLRPYYITFEKWGVNNSSVLPKSAGYYLEHSQNIPENKAPAPITGPFVNRAWLATHYYMSMYFCRDSFPNYQHHRDHKVLNYIGAWCLSGWRKYAYKFQEHFFTKSVQHENFPEFFIVPLQVHNDSQVKDFSRAKNIPAFIKTIIESFANYADKALHIVFKHHPMDRGFNHYGRLIKKLAKRYNIEGRVHYVFDVALPVFLRKAKGMVVINSTSGISALLHGMPVKAFGKAPYDFEGVTDQQPLKYFWNNPIKPNGAVFKAYREYLLWKTQLNASFYANINAKNSIQYSYSNQAGLETSAVIGQI